MTIKLLALGATGTFFLLSSGLSSYAEANPNRSHRPIPSWYFGLNGSVSFVEDADYSLSTTAGSASGGLSLDSGWGVAGSIGYRPRYTNSMLDHLRFEAELGFSYADLGRVTLGGVMLTDADLAAGEVFTDIDTQRYMANMYVDFNLGPQLRPYIGAGVGAARVSLAVDSDTAFAYQGMVGLYYTPSSFPLVEIGGGYRYFAATDLTFNSSSSGTGLSMDYISHNIEAGFRAYF